MHEYICWADETRFQLNCHWGRLNWVPLSQHIAGVDGTGFHFPNTLLGWVELGSTFPTHCWGGWNWVPLFPAHCWGGWNRVLFPSIMNVKSGHHRISSCTIAGLSIPQTNHRYTRPQHPENACKLCCPKLFRGSRPEFLHHPYTVDSPIQLVDYHL